MPSSDTPDDELRAPNEEAAPIPDTTDTTPVTVANPPSNAPGIVAVLHDLVFTLSPHRPVDELINLLRIDPLRQLAAFSGSPTPDQNKVKSRVLLRSRAGRSARGARRRVYRHHGCRTYAGIGCRVFAGCHAQSNQSLATRTCGGEGIGRFRSQTGPGLGAHARRWAVSSHMKTHANRHFLLFNEAAQVKPTQRAPLARHKNNPGVSALRRVINFPHTRIFSEALEDRCRSKAARLKSRRQRRQCDRC